MAKINNTGVLKEAQKYLAGGVDSPVRNFAYAGLKPLVIKRGKGAYLYDYENKRYIDYILSWGAAILGHAYPAVVSGVKKTIESGSNFGLTNKAEAELAGKICAAVPLMENIRFVNSGTEAVMGALRLARGYTGRNKILKFEHSYHGSADYLLSQAGSGLATAGIPSSKGVPKDYTKHTPILPFDLASVKRIFKNHGRDIAAVIVEPVGGNFGVVKPDAEMLLNLRKITKAYGSLLVFDEVITGFRFHFGIAAQIFGVNPDLVVLGKIVGGCLPIGAFGGKKKIMRMLSPLGDVYHAGTFCGNPVVMESGIKTLNALKKNDYKRLNATGDYLAGELARILGSSALVSHYGSMFSVRFRRKNDFSVFYRRLVKAGVLLAPSEFEANFISFKHTPKDIEHTLKSFRLRETKFMLS